MPAGRAADSIDGWGNPAVRALLTLGGMLFVALNAQGLPGGTLPWSETFDTFLPWRVEAARQWRSGQFPFFSGQVFGGLPLFSQAFVGVLYPPNILFVLLPPVLALHASDALHVALGYAGMLLYLRSRRLGPLAAFTGTALYLTLGFLVVREVHLTMREAALIAPWVAWGARRLLRRPGPGRAAAFAGLLALHFFCGYAQLTLFVVIWCGAEWATWARPDRRFAVRTAWLAAGGVVGTAIAAVQVIPARALAGISQRAGYAREEFLRGSAHPEDVLQWIQPLALGSPLRPWVRWDESWEQWAPGLAAIPVLALAAFAWGTFRGGQARRVPVVFGTVALAATLASFGNSYGVSRAIVEWPVFEMFRIPARWGWLAAVMACVAAAYGVQAMLYATRRGAILLAAGAVAAWLALAVGVFAASNTYHGYYNIARATLGTGGSILLFLSGPAIVAGIAAARGPAGRMAAGVVVAAVAAAWFLGVRAPLDFVPVDPAPYYTRAAHPLLGQVPDEPITRIATLTPDIGLPDPFALRASLNLPLGIRSLNGGAPLVSERQMYYLGMGLFGQNWLERDHLGSLGHLDTFAVSHVIIDEGTFTPEQREVFAPWRSARLEPLAAHGGLVLNRVRDPLPRYGFAPAWEHNRNDEPNWEDYLEWLRIWQDDRPVRERPVLLRKYREDRFPPAGVALAGGNIRVEEERDALIRLAIETESPQVLLVRDFYWPGWRWRVEGWLDGRWRRVEPANGVLMAVPVPAGTHVVELRYRPVGWDAGLRASIGGMAVLLALIGWGFISRRREQPVPGRVPEQ